MRLSGDEPGSHSGWRAGISTPFFQTKAFAALRFLLRSTERLPTGVGGSSASEPRFRKDTLCHCKTPTPWVKDFFNKQLIDYSVEQYWVYNRLSGKYRDRCPHCTKKVRFPYD